AGAVADDDELEVAGVVVEAQVGPGVAVLHFDLEVAGRRSLVVARQSRGGDEDADDEAPEEQTVHAAISRWLVCGSHPSWPRCVREMCGGGAEFMKPAANAGAVGISSVLLFPNSETRASRTGPQRDNGSRE